MTAIDDTVDLHQGTATGKNKRQKGVRLLRRRGEGVPEGTYSSLLSRLERSVQGTWSESETGRNNRRYGRDNMRMGFAIRPAATEKRGQGIGDVSALHLLKPTRMECRLGMGNSRQQTHVGSFQERRDCGSSRLQ